jgi:hypothetical protein
MFQVVLEMLTSQLTSLSFDIKLSLISPNVLNPDCLPSFEDISIWLHNEHPKSLELGSMVPEQMVHMRLQSVTPKQEQSNGKTYCRVDIASELRVSTKIGVM